MQQRLLRLPRRVRLVFLPLGLLAVVAATTFALAKLHLAKPDAPASAANVTLGDAYQGELIFEDRCASCHGTGGKDGGVGPALADNPITLAAAKAKVDAGGSVMPAGLATGEDQQDVLAYLATILAKP